MKIDCGIGFDWLCYVGVPNYWRNRQTRAWKRVNRIQLSFHPSRLPL
jgi:hypothetical protein